MPRCKLENCPVAKNGRCLENRGTGCPNLIPESEGADIGADVTIEVEGSESSSDAFEPLPSVAPLEVVDARRYARRGRAVVVALAGLPDCGKTSLVARIAQLFQSGPIANWDFAGCRSLPRFEEMNWLATMESRSPHVKMLHSSAQFDNSFLHLAVRPTGGGLLKDVLLNDIAGETFKAAVAAHSACETLVALERADHLVVLVDGEALADVRSRQHHVGQVRDFLQRVLQSGQCSRQTALHLVVSKLDKLKGHENHAQKMEADFDIQFRARFGSMTLLRLAARPLDGTLPTTEPIKQLFSSWLQTTHRYPSPSIELAPRNMWPRDFCRFGN